MQYFFYIRLATRLLQQKNLEMGILKHTFSWLAILYLLLATNNTAIAQTYDDILGKWLNEQEDLTIEIYKEGSTYYGKVIWMADPNLYDIQNPDTTLRKQSIIGIDILKYFSFNPDNEIWKNGSMYHPPNGKTYSCKMWMNENGTLSIRSFIGFSLLGETNVWTRPTKTHACYHSNFRGG